MAGIFISSTGTGIGKTYLIEQLLRFDRHHERRLSASKPIISGWPQESEEIQHTDTGKILQAQQLPLSERVIAQCSPWRYFAPLTPSMAAKKEGNPIDEAKLILHCQQQINNAQRDDKIHLIEGVGGVMAPLTQQMTCLSWLKQLKCPCILVTGSYLGTISHTLTALATLQNQDIRVLCIIVNETPQSTVSLDETTEELGQWLAPLPVFKLAFNGCDSDLAMVYFCALEIATKALSCD